MRKPTSAFLGDCAAVYVLTRAVHDPSAASLDLRAHPTAVVSQGGCELAELQLGRGPVLLREHARLGVEQDGAGHRVLLVHAGGQHVGQELLGRWRQLGATSIAAVNPQGRVARGCLPEHRVGLATGHGVAERTCRDSPAL